ncbi:pentapeptide MXKDX repeat family protein [Ralstonia insidiosa]|nr:pentapeptide MXKDX repeat family protein [Ralstonia insidiosa]
MKKALITACVAGFAFVSTGAVFAQTDTMPKKEEAPMAKDAMGHDKMAKEGMKKDKMKKGG